MSETCSVCLEGFTKQPHRKAAKCPYCDVKSCVKCTQTYLVNTQDDPHCMGCRKAWGRDVMDSILLSTFLNGEYKKHRENILLDRERSRLPAAQLILERQKRAADYDPVLDALHKEYSEISAKLIQIERRIRDVNHIQWELRNGNEPRQSRDTGEDQERRTFVMPCPVTGCRGFLSQSYKCGICDTYVCPECREIKGSKTDAEHTCDPNNVATVKALKKETRPCPDCGANIFRVEGCSMMWCTVCNTPFDWNSGKKITHGRIHNPHYFEYLKAANGGVVPRDPGDIPCGANLPGAWRFNRDVYQRFGMENDAWLLEGLRVITHIHEVEINAMTNDAEDGDNTEHNLRYLRQEIDEKRWKQILQQREKRRMKRDEIRMQYEAFVGACIDIYGRLTTHVRNIPSEKTFDKVTRQGVLQLIQDTEMNLLGLRTIFNEGMMLLSKRYKCQVLQLGEKHLKMEKGRYVNPKSKGKKADSTTVTTESVSDDEGDNESVVEILEEEPPQNILVRQTP
jgi:hypothetical protein